MVVLLVIFIIVGVVNITAIVLKREKLRQTSKCLIIPPLLAAYITGAGNLFLFPIPALILGWIGDVLLLNIQKRTYFFLGLASFLLGHLCYTITFIGILGFFDFNGTINIPAIAIFTIPTIILGMVVFRLIKPTKEMSIPVIVYMIVLVTMSLLGFQVFLFNPGVAGLLILSGCFYFMVSDTILAYYIFRKPKLWGSFLLMFFYILAQAEIVLGLMLLPKT